MLNSKYSKVLTIILIIAIVIIVGLLVFIGIDWYKAYTVGKDTQNSLDQFNSYIENNQNNVSWEAWYRPVNIEELSPVSKEN